MTMMVAGGAGAQVTRPAATAQLASELSRREAMKSYRDGMAALVAEKFENAVADFRKAVEKDPLFPLAFYSMGRAYMFLQDYERAIAAYEASLGASRALHELQATHRFEVEKLRNEEIQQLREIIRRGGRTPTIMALEQHLRDLEYQKPSVDQGFRPPAEVLLSLGSALLRSGRADEAVQQWQQAVEVNQKLGEAHNNLAVVYMQTGRLAEAEAELRAAEQSGLKVNPQLKAELERRKAAK
jgi:tetratricopeptide (TPR) repeat protein